MLAFLLLLLAGVWYITNPSRISRLSEVLLSRVLGGHVTVQSGRLSFSGTLILSGVEVRTDDPDAMAVADVPIFSADQIEARFDWLTLLSGRLSATQLVATTPVFRPLEDRETGHWNYERLRPGFSATTQRAPGAPRGLTLPVVIVHDARVRWGETRKGRVTETGETIIDGELTPDALQPATYHFQFSQLSPEKNRGAVAIQDVGAIMRGTWDTAGNSFSASTDNVVMSDTLRNGMPRQAREWCQEHQLAGRLAQLNLMFNPRDGLTMGIAFDGVSMMWMVDPQPGVAVGEERPSYPLDIRDVRGKITFSLSNPAMHIFDVSGELLGYKFVIDDCKVQGAGFDAPFELKSLRFPDAVLRDDYPPLFMALITSQDLLQRIAPHGKMDIGIDIRRATKNDPIQFNGTVDCHDARMRFAHFPFPLDHINGRITFDQQSVTFENVVGKADLNDVSISGTSGTTWSNRAIDFTVTSNNVNFDDRLAAALPGEFKELWDLFSVNAHGSFVCRVTRSAALFDGQPKFVVDVEIDSGTGYVRTLPYVLRDAKGRLHFEKDETRIEHLTASTGIDGTGRVELHGVVHHDGNDLKRLEPELSVTADVPVDVALLHSLPEEWTDKLRDIALAGRMNFAGTLKRGATAEHAVQAAGTLAWSDGRLEMPLAALGGSGGKGDRVSFTGIQSEAVVSPQLLDIKRFEGEMVIGNLESIHLALSGKLNAPLMSGSLTVAAAARDFILPAAPPGYLPKNIADGWIAYAPSGKVDLEVNSTLHIHMPADAGGAAPAFRLSDGIAVASYGAKLSLHDAMLRNSAWPDSLSKLNGTVELAPGKITMNNMSGVVGGVTLTWKGLVKPESGAVAVSGDAVAAGIPEKWLKYLPETISQNIDAQQPGSSFTLHLDALNRPQGDKPWVLEGKLDAFHLVIKGPMPIRIESANAAGKGTWNPAVAGDFAFAGSLHAGNVNLSEHTLETLGASLDVQGLRHRITISEMQGKVAGGTLQGDIAIQTSATVAPAATTATATAPGTMPAEGGYAANLVLNNAELPLLVLASNASEEERKKVGTGRVSASLSLQQTFGPQGDRTGRGDLEISDANIYDVPLSMGLMQIVTLRLPVAHSFQHATMSYYLRDNDINFEKILLESPGVNLAGAGTVAIADRSLNLNFITQTPHMTIPILSAFQSELLQVTVTGTAGNPKVTPVPLSPIANMLRAILPQGQAEAH